MHGTRATALDDTSLSSADFVEQLTNNMCDDWFDVIKALPIAAPGVAFDPTDQDVMEAAEALVKAGMDRPSLSNAGQISIRLNPPLTAQQLEGSDIESTHSRRSNASRNSRTSRGSHHSTGQHSQGSSGTRNSKGSQSKGSQKKGSGQDGTAQNSLAIIPVSNSNTDNSATAPTEQKPSGTTTPNKSYAAAAQSPPQQPPGSTDKLVAQQQNAINAAANANSKPAAAPTPSPEVQKLANSAGFTNVQTNPNQGQPYANLRSHQLGNSEHKPKGKGKGQHPHRTGGSKTTPTKTQIRNRNKNKKTGNQGNQDFHQAE